MHYTLADLHKGSKEAVGRLRRISRWNAHPAKSMYSKIEAVRNENNDYIPKANESRQKRGKASNSVSTADKVTSIVFLFNFICLFNLLCAALGCLITCDI